MHTCVSLAGQGTHEGSTGSEKTTYLHELQDQHRVAMPRARAIELYNVPVETKRLQNLNLLQHKLTFTALADWCTETSVECLTVWQSRGDRPTLHVVVLP